MEGEELATLQQQQEQTFKAVSDLTKAVEGITSFVGEMRKSEQENLEKANQAESESKMFKRFLKLLKEEGVVFARKDGGKVSTAPGQTSKTSVKDPKGQQSMIQGQKKEEDEEEEEKQIPPEVRARARAGEDEEEEDEEIREKKAVPEEDEEKKALEAVNETLKSQLEEVKASIPNQIQKAIDKRMQELGWKTIGHAPARIAGGEEVAILKGEETMSKEDLIQRLLKVPLAERNEMNLKMKAGQLKMPELV